MKFAKALFFLLAGSATTSAFAPARKLSKLRRNISIMFWKDIADK
jgi:hypothetical protein